MQDSYTANEVMKVVKSLADTGITIVVSGQNPCSPPPVAFLMQVLWPGHAETKLFAGPCISSLHRKSEKTTINLL